MKKITLIIIAILFTLNITKANPVILSVKLDTTELILSFYQNGNRISEIEYYDMSIGRSVCMEGKFVDSTYIFNAEYYIYSKTVEKNIFQTFRFCEFEEGKFSGVIEENGQNYKIYLEKLTIDYETPRKQLINNLKFDTVGNFEIDGFRLIELSYKQKFGDRFDDIIFPRLLNHPKQKSGNKYLDSLHKDYIIRLLTCNMGCINEGDFQFRLNSIFVDEFNLSFKISGERCCYNRCVYPQDTYNYNFSSQNEIPLSDLIDTPKDSVGDFLLKIMQELYSEKLKEASEYCDVYSISSWDYPIWKLVEDGLIILCRGTTVNMVACNESWLLPNKYIDRKRIEY